MRVLYRLWARLPRRVRRQLVRFGAPTFSAGSICVIEHGGEVLLVRLAYRKGWGLPGGLLARGEEPAAAAIRESGEEVGIAIELLGAPTVVADPRVRRLDIVYRCRPAPGVDPSSARPRSKELVDARWWPADALPDLHPEAAAAFRALADVGAP